MEKISYIGQLYECTEKLEKVLAERDRYKEELLCLVSHIRENVYKNQHGDLFCYRFLDKAVQALSPQQPICETCGGHGKVWVSAVHGEPDSPIGKHFPCEDCQSEQG